MLLGNGPGGRSGMSRRERENLVAQRLLRRLGFATDCWSVWDELPEPVDLSIGPRASRTGGAGQRTRSTPIAASTSSGASGSVCRQVAKADLSALITHYGKSEVVIDPRRESRAS